jgi:hypothetical protein
MELKGGMAHTIFDKLLQELGTRASWPPTGELVLRLQLFDGDQAKASAATRHAEPVSIPRRAATKCGEGQRRSCTIGALTHADGSALKEMAG